MSKLKITSKQYESILLHEQKTRLIGHDGHSSELVNDSSTNLNEGWKDVVLGVSMLLGISLSGLNKVIAQDAIKNDSIMSQIKATLEDKDKVKELSDAMKEKGLKNPDSLLAKNATKVVEKFNKIATDNKLKYRVSSKVINNLSSLSDELAKGYAVSKMDISPDLEDYESKAIVTVKDSVDLDLGCDNLFITGSFELSDDGKSKLLRIFDSIKNEGGKIISVNIETSTDAEVTPKFMDDNDPTGNITLASLRTKHISELISNLDSKVSIKHREIPNNGSSVVNKNTFMKAANNPKELAELRNKTASFRYIKVSFQIEFEHQDTDAKPKIDAVIHDYRVELLKIIMDTKLVNNHNKIFKLKKFSCKHGKTASVSKIKCFTF